MSNWAVSLMSPGSVLSPKYTAPVEEISWTTLPVLPFTSCDTVRSVLRCCMAVCHWPAATRL